MKLSLMILVIALFTFGGSPLTVAEAGEWRLDPSRCPDLREDRRDARVTWSKRDAREDRRDRRVINCPARAWVYVAGPLEFLRKKPARPAYTSFVVGPHGRYYRRHKGRDIAIKIVVH